MNTFRHFGRAPWKGDRPIVKVCTYSKTRTYIGALSDIRIHYPSVRVHHDLAATGTGQVSIKYFIFYLSKCRRKIKRLGWPRSLDNSDYTKAFLKGVRQWCSTRGTSGPKKST
jgi:hypothetical protein